MKLVSQEEVYIPLASPVSWLVTEQEKKSPTYSVVCPLRGLLDLLTQQPWVGDPQIF